MWSYCILTRTFCTIILDGISTSYILNHRPSSLRIFMKMQKIHDLENKEYIWSTTWKITFSSKISNLKSTYFYFLQTTFCFHKCIMFSLSWISHENLLGCETFKHKIVFHFQIFFLYLTNPLPRCPWWKRTYSKVKLCKLICSVVHKVHQNPKYTYYYRGLCRV